MLVAEFARATAADTAGGYIEKDLVAPERQGSIVVLGIVQWVTHEEQITADVGLPMPVSDVWLRHCTAVTSQCSVCIRG